MSKGRKYRDFDDDHIERKARKAALREHQAEDRDWKFDPRKNYLDGEDNEEEFDQIENWHGYRSG